MLLDLAVHARDHLALSLSALASAIAVAVPAGTWLAGDSPWRGPLMGTIATARVIPSLAVLTLMIPFIGIGFAPALVALVLLALPPIAINTERGLRSIPQTTRDAARGLGMTPGQMRMRVEWPLAMPVVFAGIRTATVEVIASATLAAYIGGGGLGEYIVNGLANNDTATLLEGALGVGALALLAEGVLGTIERRLSARSGTVAA
jgi:osmoprotectant transport system permease protein